MTKAVAMIGFVAVLLLLVFGLLVLNRDSEKVVTTVVSAAISALTVIAAVIAFSGDEPTSVSFPVKFLFDAADKVPVTTPDRSSSDIFFLTQVPELLRIDPTSLREQPDTRGMLVYHELLQKMFLDWMTTKYAVSWVANFYSFKFEGGGAYFGGQATPETRPSKLLKQEDIAAILGANRFARIPPPLAPQLAIPPGTTIRVLPFDEKTATGSVELRNRFAVVTLRTTPLGWGVGLGGYEAFVEDPRAHNQNAWGNATFSVRIDASFTSWLAGHPDMRLYRRWAKQIAEGLQQQFDEREVWRDMLERRRVSAEMVQPYRNLRPGFGRIAAPERPAPPAAAPPAAVAPAGQPPR